MARFFFAFKLVMLDLVIDAATPADPPAKTSFIYEVSYLYFLMGYKVNKLEMYR